MIKFDVRKLRIETYWVKSLTTALGGAIRVLDEELSEGTKEVYHRIPVPMAVVRQFKTRHKTMKYIRPCLIAVAYYDDRAIALERHPAGCMGLREERFEGVLKHWTPAMQDNIKRIIEPLVLASGVWNEATEEYDFPEKHDWFFDGRYIFTFETTKEAAIKKGEYLSKDGRFRCVDVNAIGLHKLDDRGTLHTTDRTCLAYVAANRSFAISPPIWKNARQVGEAKIKGTHKSKDGTTKSKELNFDKVDQFCAVNLSFALKAAGELSKEFGFEATEPLNLPQLMIKLNTVNLPKVPSEVKDTFDSGMKFTHALAWMLGFARRCENLETYATIRSLMKYLTSNGLFYKQAFDPVNIFHKGQNLDTIPLLSKQEALAGFETMSLKDRLDIIRIQRERALNKRGGNVVPGMGLYSEND